MIVRKSWTQRNFAPSKIECFVKIATWQKLIFHSQKEGRNGIPQKRRELDRLSWCGMKRKEKSRKVIQILCNYNYISEGGGIL
mmetsp:Transcript_33593/g.52512  ORF Transcript_33593/g.52512 Transcript_33593/m.52512 type:complete len:83 (+) Transcript_33593:579-827(+)